MQRKISKSSLTRSMLLTLTLAPAVEAAVSSASDSPTANCESLLPPAGVTFEAPPSWQTREGLPRFCQVRGQIDGRTRFEMRLPQEWNGRFVMAGCGGFCGSLLPDKPGYSNSINEALKKGYAAISQDGGHQAKSWETHWAYNDPEALELYAHKILPQVTTVGSELTESMYGRPPRHKYYSGCSNGGRLGLMAAQKYPDLFDGIAAGGSIFSISQIAGLWGNWMIQQTLPDNQAVFDRSKNPLIKTAIMQQCDSLDGQKDGVISDPRQCQFDFTQLQCDNSTTDTANCLTADESEMLNRLYGGVKDSKGNFISPAASLGSEHYTDIWLFGSKQKPAWGVAASTGYRHLLSNDLHDREEPRYQSTDTMLDWISRSSVPAMTDASQADLSELKKSDTKLMIYHGWSDPLIIPEPMVDYYNRAIEKNGGLEQLQENARLFMIPGWGHCWERPAEAPAEFDPLEIVANWVESGKAPDSFVAEQRNTDRALIRARPICAYPKVATLIEGKDPNKAESYQCSES